MFRVAGLHLTAPIRPEVLMRGEVNLDTVKAKKTYRNLLTTSEAVFEERGFYNTTVTEICRRAQLANGTFYRYFKDKDEIFAVLAGRLSEDFTEQIEGALRGPNKSFIEKLEAVLLTYFSFLGEHSSTFQIFRQAEFVDQKVHQSFYSNITKTFVTAFEKAKSEGKCHSHHPQILANWLLGALSFTSMRWIIWDSSSDTGGLVQDLLSFISYGIDSGNERLKIDNVTPFSRLSNPNKKTDKVKDKLLFAAEDCFGRNGFFETAVVDITRKADVAQGTFYHYFSSKVEVFQKLVYEINRRWRREVGKAIANLDDRRLVEYHGFRVFFSFIVKHPQLYRIVREAEFVDKQVGQWFYRRFAEGYKRGLEEAMNKGQIREFQPEVLAYILMGIGHFFGLKWFVSENRDQYDGEEFDEMFDLILHGLSG